MTLRKYMDNVLAAVLAANPDIGLDVFRAIYVKSMDIIAHHYPRGLWRNS